MQTRHTLVRNLSWILFVVIFTPLILAYYQANLLAPSSLYAIFPVFGLLAWSLLCAQYVSGTIRTAFRIQVKNNPVFAQVSGTIILVSLLLHPLLLLIQCYVDTETLPPTSLVSYIGDARMYLIWMAVIALIFFLLFDILKPWRKSLRKSGVWRYVSLVQILAMLLIFVHGLLLGSLFVDGWIQAWWIILNIVLVPCYMVHVYQDFRSVE